MEYQNTDITKYMPLVAVIESHVAAIEQVKKAFAHLEQAKSHLKNIHNEKYSHRENVLDYRGNNSEKECCDRIKINTWQLIVEKSQIRYLLTAKKTNELEKMLGTADALPDVTVENIQQFISNISGDMPNLFKEACCEVFDILRPRRSEYKTNTEFEIGEKVILNCMVDFSFRYCHINYGREKYLLSIDNVFHLLDGKGGTKYPGDLTTAINAAMRDNKWDAETEYFKVKWYQKGSMHIQFKRLDLVKELNRHAGGNRLRTAAA